MYVLIRVPSALDWNEEVVIISSFWHGNGAPLSRAHPRRQMRRRDVKQALQMVLARTLQRRGTRNRTRNRP